jgi:hypothetical protein
VLVCKVSAVCSHVYTDLWTPGWMVLLLLSQLVMAYAGGDVV